MTFVKGPICAEINNSIVNNLITIGEASSNSAIRYICPKCRQQMIARIKHAPDDCFRHRYNQGCDFDFKASLVKVIFDMLEKEKKLYIPNVYIEFKAKPKELLKKGNLYNIGKVEFGDNEEDCYPDIKITAQGKKLYIIIKTIHDPSNKLKKYVKQENLSAILLDFTKYKGPISKQEIKDILFADASIKSWLNNKTANEWFEKFFAVTVAKTVKGMVVHGCPDGKLDKDGNKIANIEFDCIYCPYCILHGTESLYCTGDSKIATVEDLKKYLKME